jgi:hypothetical protein
MLMELQGTLATMSQSRMIHRSRRRFSLCFTASVAITAKQAGALLKMAITGGRPLGTGFLPWGFGENSDDLDFIDEMIVWAKANYNIRETHIFTTGHSYGAMFSYAAARWRGDVIAAFGEHSGNRSTAVPSGPNPTPKLNGILLHAVDDGLVNYSGSQTLYDELVANGHNVYEDGIGTDGIIEVNGWGPDNHRYRKVHNQTQWDFFMASAPAIIDDDSDGWADVDDNCSLVANPQQEDADGDSVGNVCDNCVLTPNTDQLDADEDGVGDLCTAIGC